MHCAKPMCLLHFSPLEATFSKLFGDFGVFFGGSPFGPTLGGHFVSLLGVILDAGASPGGPWIPFWGLFGTPWSPWAPVESLWGPLGPRWTPLESLLGPCGSFLGAPGSFSGNFWLTCCAFCTQWELLITFGRFFQTIGSSRNYLLQSFLFFLQLCLNSTRFPFHC